jgi:hypothetical protein
MIKNCPKCNGNRTKRFGRTLAKKQRYLCLACGRSFIWKNVGNKNKRQQKWFKDWIKEGYSLRQLKIISGRSYKDINRIKSFWLKQDPPAQYDEYKSAKYLIFDGTYFNKKNCLIVFMNNEDGKTIGCRYLDKENYKNVLNLGLELKAKGVTPKAITLDGHQAVIRALREVWPEAKIQRCLYHMQRQGLMWLRYRPRTQVGMELRQLVTQIAKLKSHADKALFSRAFKEILTRNHAEISGIKADVIGISDTKKIITLITNAYRDMWHFLGDRKIPKTTNKIEGYFGELKQKYIRHKGMWQKSREQYLKWYCYYKNNPK